MDGLTSVEQVRLLRQRQVDTMAPAAEAPLPSFPSFTEVGEDGDVKVDARRLSGRHCYLIARLLVTGVFLISGGLNGSVRRHFRAG